MAARCHHSHLAFQSTSRPVSQLKVLPTISVVALTAFLLLSPFAASAAGATVTVKTDQTSYSGAQTLSVFGTVTPAPTATGTNIAIKVTNQATHATVLITVAGVDTNGNYNTRFVTGGTAS